MSKVRRNCTFCLHGGGFPTYAPCCKCIQDVRRPDWKPSTAGQIALDMEADLAAAREQLQRVRVIVDEMEKNSRGYAPAWARVVREELVPCLRWAIGDSARAELDGDENART